MRKNELASPEKHGVNPWRVPYPKGRIETADIPVAALPEASQMRRGKRKAVFNVIAFFMRVLFRMRAEHTENIPEEGPVIMISEHGSMLDIPLIHLTSPTWIYWLAKIELFRNRFGFHFFPWWGAIPVDRDKMHVRTAREVLDTLKKKRIMGVFPQGRRCATEEEIRTTEPKLGAVAFALRSNAKILPVAIEGNYRLFSKHKVIYGKLHEIKLPSGKKKLTDAEERGLALEMMQAVFSLRGAEYPFQYPEGTEVSQTSFFHPVL